MSTHRGKIGQHRQAVTMKQIPAGRLGIAFRVIAWAKTELRPTAPASNLTPRPFPEILPVMPSVVVAAIRRGFRALTAVLALGVWAATARAEEPASPPPELLTNLFQLRCCANQDPAVVHPFRIVADVVDVDPAGGVLVLRDSSGVEFVQLDMQGRTFIPGTTVRLEGQGYAVTLKGFGLALVPGLVVDNDGVHPTIVKIGTTFLHAGLNPITVQWFNRTGDFSLNVEYEGPNLPRQSIPGSVLLKARVDSEAGTTNFSAGLDYRCYEGTWGYLPDFAKLHSVKTGIATNFDLAVRTRDENVGLEFNGFITIPRAGYYTFHLASDDGSRLWVGGSSLEVSVSSQGPPPQVPEQVRKTVPKGKRRPWVTLEGTVNFAGVRGVGGELEMRVGNNDIGVEIFQGGESATNFPPDTKVRLSGIYQDVTAEDGSPRPGRLLVPGWNAVHRVQEPGNGLASVVGNNGSTNQVAGKVASATNTIPAVSTVAEVKALSSESAKQQLPVSVRGVVTAVLPSATACAVVQDSTKGISIFLQDLKQTNPLRPGEFCQIDGITGPGLFAPVIVARRITHLGAGQMPEPLHPTWDQMMNGSLDTQYAEIEGAITAVHGQQIEMLTESGKITLELSDFQSEDLAPYEGAVVRIRGCVFVGFNTQTHELQVGLLRMTGGALEVLQAAPRDPFGAPQKSIGELLLYDPKTAPFRRLKVSGQVIYGRAGEYFLTDGANGVRVITRNSDHFAIGELVDAVGFLELGGPMAELKEAVMRKLGSASLPQPTKLLPEHLLQAGYAGTFVQVDATLMNQWSDGPEYVLELQSGFLAFRARIDSHGQPISLPPAGSRLELTGAYAPLGNGPDAGTVSGFELLLHSPAGVRVLATPPWWTLKRVLILAGILAALLGVVLIWNKELQWKVQERGRQLEIEIRHRQQAELQRAAEAERSRIARDLHDELGSGLTEVSLLAGAGQGEFRDVEKGSDRFRVIADKARALVSGLDVIVWAIDPKRNSLQSFTDYLGRYATELFSASNIVCRFKIPIECDAVTLTEAARHSLFLAVKEALNNVIRHSSATEVELQISQIGDRLQIVIADNGRGFDWNTVRRGNGLTNLYERLETLNGQCQLESKAGKGTTVKFVVPLPAIRTDRIIPNHPA